MPTRPSTTHPAPVDPARLQTLFAKLRAPPSGRATPSVPSIEPLGLLGGLLELVDETVMARSLTVSNAAGQQLRLDVCNRRLFQVSLLGEAPWSMSARDLTYAGGDDLQALRTVLETFAAPGSLLLRSEPAEDRVRLEDTGLAAGALAARWADAAPDEGTDLEALCAALTPFATAWLFVDGRDDVEAKALGPDLAVAALVDLHAKVQLEELSPDLPFGILALSKGVESVVVLRNRESVAAFVLPSANLRTFLDRLPGQQPREDPSSLSQLEGRTAESAVHAPKQ